MMISLALTLAVQDARPFDASKHPWLKWKEGSFVRFAVSGAGPATEVGEDLKKGEPPGYVLSAYDTMMGKARRDRKKKPGDACAHCDPTAVKVGRETLTVDGKDYVCDVWKFDSDQQGMFVKEEKAWMTDGIDVPLRVRYSVSQGVTATRDLTAVKVGETLAVGDQKVACVVLKGTHRLETRDGPSTSLITLWLSSDIPGGLVREDQRSDPADPGTSKSAVDFKAIR